MTLLFPTIHDIIKASLTAKLSRAGYIAHRDICPRAGPHNVLLVAHLDKGSPVLLANCNVLVVVEPVIL